MVVWPLLADSIRAALPFRLQREAEALWPQWQIAVRRGREALEEALMAFLDSPPVREILANHFSTPEEKARELAGRITALCDQASAVAFSSIEDVYCDRRARIHYLPDFLQILEQTNPGTRERVERILTTRFSRLTEGLDYDQRAGARTVLLVLGVPFRINGRLDCGPEAQGRRLRTGMVPASLPDG